MERDARKEMERAERAAQQERWSKEEGRRSRGKKIPAELEASLTRLLASSAIAIRQILVRPTNLAATKPQRAPRGRWRESCETQDAGGARATNHTAIRAIQACAGIRRILPLMKGAYLMSLSRSFRGQIFGGGGARN